MWSTRGRAVGHLVHHPYFSLGFSKVSTPLGWKIEHLLLFFSVFLCFDVFLLFQFPCIVFDVPLYMDGDALCTVHCTLCYVLAFFVFVATGSASPSHLISYKIAALKSHTTDVCLLLMWNTGDELLGHGALFTALLLADLQLPGIAEERSMWHLCSLYFSRLAFCVLTSSLFC